MTNKEVADILNEIAEILQIKGDSKYRVRAYQQASRSIEFMAEDIGDLYREHRLDDIPYVGEGIAARISDMMEHGSSRYLEELEESIPPGIGSLLEVPGIGPGTALRLYRELGITDLEALRSAAESGRIRSLKGMGVKSEQNILQGIKWLRGHTPRMLLGRASVLVERILSQLSQDPFVRNLVVVGSYRRMQESVGDLDIMGTSSRAETVIDRFTSLPEVERVMAKGSTKATVISHQGVQVDLRIVPHESLGSLMQHFTGSKEHNVQLREYALSRGLSISEYGITNLKTGWRIPCSEEEQVYNLLGLPWIPPEMREGTGEIEAALAGKLPILVEIGDIEGDLHAHSNWSDGRSSLEEMANAARERGYSYLAVTDHSPGLGVAHGLSRERLKKQWREIDRLNEGLHGLRLLKGCEVDIRVNGTLDLPDNMLEKLDIVLGAIHSGMREPRRQMTERIIRAMSNPHLNILTHPTGRLIGSRQPYEVDMEAVFRAAAHYGVAMEINCNPDRLDLDGRLARVARDMGVRIAINTDTHQTAGFNNLRFGIGTARRGWLEKKDVINTRRLDELSRLLRRRRPGAGAVA